MIAPDKQRQALSALNVILVLARALASEQRSADLAIILDVAEYLPLLMLDRADRTHELREQLVGLASRYPAFSEALSRFDRSTID